MSNFLKAGFFAIAFALIFSALGVKDANAQGGNTEILRRMDIHYKSLQTLEADVKMEKLNAQLSETDTYEGDIWYIPAKGKNKMALRLDWEKPLVENLIVINNLYRLFRPRNKVEYRGSVNQAKNSSSVAGPLTFMSMSKAELNKNYLVTYIGREVVGATGTSHIELKPKTAQKYKSAELWVDDNGMPVQAKIIEKNNDATTVLLTGLKKNVTIDLNKIFALDTPKDTKIIKN